MTIDQCGYIKGRFIGQNVRLVEDIIDYCDGKDIVMNKQNTEGIRLGNET